MMKDFTKIAFFSLVAGLACMSAQDVQIDDSKEVTMHKNVETPRLEDCQLKCNGCPGVGESKFRTKQTRYQNDSNESQANFDDEDNDNDCKSQRCNTKEEKRKSAARKAMEE